MDKRCVENGGQGKAITYRAQKDIDAPVELWG
jgi:hypothetical protein